MIANVGGLPLDKTSTDVKGQHQAKSYGNDLLA